jgi:hypothetical protein
MRRAHAAGAGSNTSNTRVSPSLNIDKHADKHVPVDGWKQCNEALFLV